LILLLYSFALRDYGITDISLAEGVTYKGEKTVPLEAGYLMGQSTR
jgi:hypothetical protein